MIKIDITSDIIDDNQVIMSNVEVNGSPAIVWKEMYFAMERMSKADKRAFVKAVKQLTDKWGLL